MLEESSSLEPVTYEFASSLSFSVSAASRYGLEVYIGKAFWRGSSSCNGLQPLVVFVCMSQFDALLLCRSPLCAHCDQIPTQRNVGL